jgi:hypothetical protein
MAFNEYFTIINNSPYTMVFDDKGSDGLGDGAWPSTIAANSSVPQFEQTGQLSINVTVVYNLQNSNPATNVYLHFYCYGAGVVHVDMSLSYSSDLAFPNSSIQENNTSGGGEYEVATGSGPTLSITTNSVGSSRGNAIFTIGG